MKEKVREPLVASRKPAATPSGPAAKGNDAATADALQHSPRQATQRKQLEQAFGKPASAPVQRVKGRPTKEELESALAGSVSSAMGTCCAKTSEAYSALARFVDGDGDLGAVLLTWAENVGTDDFDVGNHTAATATWNEGTFVVDTSAGQFGGPAIYIDTIANWRHTILGLQRARVSHDSCEVLDRPIGDSSMSAKALDRAFEIRQELKPKEKPKVTEESKVEGAKSTAKAEPENKPKKKTKCYLTSACVEYRGLADDCHELTVLRAFRDGYMSALPEGPALIEAYYGVAPALVDAIGRDAAAKAIWNRVYQVVAACVRDIEAGRPADAMDAYMAMVRTLLARCEIESVAV